MAAYFDSGFCVRKPSWHRQENLLDEYPKDYDEARTLAGLDWEPTYSDMYVPEVMPLSMFEDAATVIPEGAIEVARNDGFITLHVPVDGFRAIVRSDNRHVLATPKDSWELITHNQMGELIEAYTAAWRKAGATVMYETMGSVKEGGLVWVLVKLDEPFNIKGDDSATYPFAVLLNAHDGSASCRLTPTMVRVVCWNTWKAAEYDAEASGTGIVLRHTGDMEAKLAQAKETLSTMRDEALAWQEQANDLASLRIDDGVVKMFLEEFIPIPEAATERHRNMRAERQSIFRKLYAESMTNGDLPDTAYKLVQTAGEYLDHIRPARSADTYLSRTVLDSDPIKRKIIPLVRELAAVGAN